MPEEREEGRGATLFDAPMNGNHRANAALERGSDARVRHQPANGVDEPGGHAGFGEDGDEIGMIDTVKSFGSVDEEKEVWVLVVEMVVKGVGYFVDVVVATTPADKATLATVD